jgi:hypothetical protein
MRSPAPPKKAPENRPLPITRFAPVLATRISGFEAAFVPHILSNALKYRKLIRMSYPADV